MSAKKAVRRRKSRPARRLPSAEEIEWACIELFYATCEGIRATDRLSPSVAATLTRGVLQPLRRALKILDGVGDGRRSRAHGEGMARSGRRRREGVERK